MCSLDLGDEVLVRLANARDAFASALPGLKGVRDSIVHAEDRAQGKVHGKKIDTKPLTSGPVLAPNGGVMVRILEERHFRITIADGTCAVIEISDATTEIARIAVQAVFDALPWYPWGRTYLPSQ